MKRPTMRELALCPHCGAPMRPFNRAGRLVLLWCAACQRFLEQHASAA